MKGARALVGRSVRNLWRAQMFAEWPLFVRGPPEGVAEFAKKQGPLLKKNIAWAAPDRN